MKIFKKVLKVFLIIFISLFLVVGFVIFMLSDGNINEPDYLKNASSMELNVNEILSKGLKDTKETKDIEIALDEKELSIILKTTLLKANDSLEPLNVNVITAYVDIEDNNQMSFKAHFSATNLKSSISGNFSYTLTNDGLTMSLSKITVGKIGIGTSLVKNFVNSDQLNKTLNAELNDKGLKFNLNSDSLSISISLESVKEMLLEELNSTSDTYLYESLLSLIFRVDNMLELVSASDKFGLNINVDKLSYNTENDVEKPYSIDFEDITAKIEQLLNNNIITSDEASAVGTYLVKGYNKLDGAERSIVDSIDFSSIGISNSADYTGVLVYENELAEDLLASQVPTKNDDFVNFTGLKITEENFNNMLLRNDLVGGMNCFVRKEADSYKVSYIAVESVYVDLKDNHLALYITMSLNGQTIVLNMELNAPESNNFEIKCNVASIRIGSEILNEYETKTLISYLDSTIDLDWIRIRPNDVAIDIDFTNIFARNEHLRRLVEKLHELQPDKNLKTKINENEILISL